MPDMNISETTRKQIERFEPGRVFSYSDIPAYSKSPSATVKALSRLTQEGGIKRLSKGLFYRPEQGLFGELKPSDTELLKSILFKDGQQKGYITGTALFNNLGLTTQVPRTITVAVEGGRQAKDFGTLKAKLIKSRAPINEADVVLLQYLDVLQNIKSIPAAAVNDSLGRMAGLIKNLSQKERKRIQSLACRYYSPVARAELGLLLQTNNQPVDQALRNSLNPLTHFVLALDANRWPHCFEWNIKPEDVKRADNLSLVLNPIQVEDGMDPLVEKYREDILSLAKANGVCNIRVFGSMVRNEAGLDSDLDLLVDLDKNKSGLALGGFLADVSALLNRKVDVVTEKALHPRIRAKVMQEARAL
jgi:predicted nucleotidyltransferase